MNTHLKTALSLLCLFFALTQVTQGLAKKPRVKKSKKQAYVIPKILLEEVKKGNGEAAYFIADTFLNGNEKIKTNRKQALIWLKKAADLKNPHAILTYADELDYDDKQVKALKYYQQAAEHGMGKGFEMIANYHLEGKAGLAQDCLIAYEFYQKAELTEYKSAFNNHAWSLATNKSPACRNPERALRIYYKMLALYGDEYIPWYVLDTKAAVLAAVSDFGQAIKIQKQIISSIKELGITVKPEYLKHLESYEKRRMWVED